MADSSKTEEATPRRRLKAREQGQVTRSRELTAAVSMFSVAAVVFLMAQQAAPHWTDFFRNTLDSASTDSIQAGGPLLYWTCIETIRWTVPIMLCALAGSLVAGLAQGGFVFAPDALAPNFERFSPAKRIGQMFSLASVSTSLKSLLPFGAIAWVGIACVRAHWGEILESSYTGPRGFTTLVGGMLFEVGWKSGLILLVWAAVDYLLLWFKSEGDMKMSRQEIREEMKDSDGNPQNKARMRKMAAAIAAQADDQSRGDCNRRHYEPDPLCGRIALRDQHARPHRGGKRSGPSGAEDQRDCSGPGHSDHGEPAACSGAL